MASKSDMPKPGAITGGCLCGAIRYKVVFPPGHDFANGTSTCQCTQCRKNSGSLFFINHRVPLDAFTYTSSTETLRTYKSSEDHHRGFCATCGGFLFWREEKVPFMDLSVGCFDPEFLFDEEGEGRANGVALTRANEHYWCGNQIRGVTDVMLKGKKWMKGSAYGVLISEDV